MSRSRPAAFTGDGTDGKLDYTLVPADLQSQGPWEIMVHLVFASGLDIRSGAVVLAVDKIMGAK